MKPELVQVNGQAVDALSALDRGLHYGDGLFETIACIDGRPRLLAAHLARLAHGCERLRIATDVAAIGREVRALAGWARAIVKVIVTRGDALARGYAPSLHEKATRITLRYAWAAEDPGMALEGIRVRIANLRLGENPALAGIKHLNRLEQVQARAEWNDAGIREALMFSSSGTLISGTSSNVFLVRGGRLLTPRLDRAGVRGVMRGCVLELAQAAGLAVAEELLSDADLAGAEEIFLTNALSGILPVRELAGAACPVGPVTRRLQAQLTARLHAPDTSGASAYG
jgi:4-amino-4-deoxychorismate lyase